MANREIVLLTTGLTAVVLASIMATSGATLCYVCHMEPRSNHCMDARQLQDSRNKYEDTLNNNGTRAEALSKVTETMHDCPASMPYCVHEVITRAEQYILYYRDCSDGVKFSASVTGTRLENSPKDNSTHCATVEKPESAQMCVTLCDTDLCNGPASTSGAQSPLSLASVSSVGLLAIYVTLGVVMGKECVV